ncbi:MAG: archaetidylserine decarboxylase [Alicyclobacillus sp.]|nr:archaetidylserine decarboxylase [Alicyclobacillus sp.]
MRRAWDGLWVRLLPKRLVTAAVGMLAATPQSRALIPWFVRHYGIDVDEAELPLPAYRSWAEFFSRRLRPGARVVASCGVASPVDGRASCCGRLEEETMVQAKGRLYRLSELVVQDDCAAWFRGGHYLTLYLSPRDYHRVHAPLDGTVTRWTYVPGTLYPVNAAGVSSVRGLFAKNERLVIELNTPFGLCALVLVGATIVGSIRTAFGPAPQNPFRRRAGGIQSDRVSIPVRRGEELGYFAFGSTVICLFPPGWPLQFQVAEGDPVRMGQCVASLPFTPATRLGREGKR